MLLTRSSQAVRACTPAAPARTVRVQRRVVCQASSSDGASRRDMLLMGTAAVASPLVLAAPATAEEKLMPVASLGTFQRAAQRAEVLKRADTVLREVLAASDASGCMALLLHDAATYDPVTKAGGVDGSIVLASEELSRPENASLKPLVDKLRKAKETIDAGRPEGQAPLSWADLLVLAARTTVQAGWRDIKLSRAQTVSGGKLIADAYGAEWQVRLGRKDSSEAGPAGKFPAPNASTAEIKAFMKQLGAKPDTNPGPFAAKPPFWERPLFAVWPLAQADPLAAEAQLVADDPAAFSGVKEDYDRSRRTLTRTDYEVDFINAFSKLADVGASFETDAYLYPEKTLALRF